MNRYLILNKHVLAIVTQFLICLLAAC